MSNVILIAQPRSGGTLAMKVLAKLFNKTPQYECFNTHGYGFDKTKFATATDYKLDRIDFLKQDTNNVIKASWFDLKDVVDEINDLDAEWFHLQRENPVEMVCSSYLSYLSGVFHETNDEDFNPLNDVNVPMEFVDDFFSDYNYGGWYYNLSKNIELLNGKNFTQLYYDDSMSESDIAMQVTSEINNFNYKTDIIKLYPNKHKVVKNYADIETRIRRIL